MASGHVNRIRSRNMALLRPRSLSAVWLLSRAKRTLASDLPERIYEFTAF